MNRDRTRVLALRQFARPTGDCSAYREHGCARGYDCVRGHDCAHDQRQALLDAGAAGQPDGKRCERSGCQPRSRLAGNTEPLRLGIAKIWVLSCGVLGKACDFVVAQDLRSGQ